MFQYAALTFSVVDAEVGSCVRRGSGLSPRLLLNGPHANALQSGRVGGLIDANRLALRVLTFPPSANLEVEPACTFDCLRLCSFRSCAFTAATAAAVEATLLCISLSPLCLCVCPILAQVSYTPLTPQ